tara:strand:+ start:76268 stop:76933 length:666 start_codon:yes stop_codon:yes gene_type:complete
MPDAVFFDLDGTLIDTAPDFYTVINATLHEAGRPPVTFSAVREQVSNGGKAMIDLGFGLKPGDTEFDHWLNRFLDRYEQHLAVDTVLFDGMAEVLDQLDQHNIPWGIVTNKPTRFTLPVLQGLNLIDRIGPIICPDDVSVRKPDPEGLLIAAKQTHSKPEKCIYVGDHIRDIAAGRNARMTTIAALFGYIDATENPQDWHADHYIEHASELPALFELSKRL